jgi:diguanylate cyclase (GGDEF)-like protein/PAS domain S-box-containing protein
MSFDETDLPEIRQVEGREWWLWGFAVVVTLVLTFGIIALTFPGLELGSRRVDALALKEWARGLAALVLLFDIYTVYQHLQLQRLRRRLQKRDRLFHLITENAADMIAVVDHAGRRLYNSPAHLKVLGYSHEELTVSPPVDRVHPDDRARMLSATERARASGIGQRVEYRTRHKDGSWRVLESNIGTIRGLRGEMEGLVVVNRDITERKRAEEMLAHNLLHDGLTGLANRTLLLDRLARSLATSRRHTTFKFAVLFIDIDGFQVFNDSLGHVAGDALLVECARRLTACLRRMDTVSRPRVGEDQIFPEHTLARPGGDEFVVLAEELRDPSDAIRMAERIRSKLSFPFHVADHEIVITASIGVAFSNPNDTNAEAEDVLRNAEIAMYRAKHSGKARCEVFDNAMHAAALQRLQLETDLRRGADQGEFCLYYQPILSLHTGLIVGFETLARWLHPSGIILPGDFIALANETGIIVAINRQTFPHACQHLRRWQTLFPSDPPLFLSFNISPKEFGLADLSDQMALRIRQSGMDPRCLHLEITETIAMADAERSARVLSELKTLGVDLDIDDFGTGYSSLSRLQGFQVDTLKIDRAFICRIDTDPRTLEIVRVIVELAHSLGLRVVAEGVETHPQLTLLRQLGCERVQGYLFSKPVAPEHVPALLEANRRQVGGPLSKAVGSSPG